MAKKRSASAQKKNVNELDILFPERSAEIAGRTITVREYGFVEGQRLLYLAEPLINEIKQIYVDIPDYQDIYQTIIIHNDNVNKLVAKACNIEIDFITLLNKEEGKALYWLWWETNKEGLFYYFKEEGKTNNNSLTWAEIYTYLLTQGIQHDKIGKLTLRQIYLIYENLQKLDRKKMASDITSMSIGVNGGKETAKIVEKLRE